MQEFPGLFASVCGTGFHLSIVAFRLRERSQRGHPFAERKATIYPTSSPSSENRYNFDT